MTDTAGPGAIGVVPVDGLGGLGIQLGELINDRRDGAQHAFVLLDDGTVLEAEPEGARVSPLEHCAKPVAWIDPPLSDDTRARIVRRARSKKGSGYNWWSYVWIGLSRFGMRPKWLRKRVADPDNNMCSQLCDLIWQEVAAELPADSADKRLLRLFDDGRLPGNVTPGDLAWIAATKPWESQP